VPQCVRPAARRDHHVARITADRVSGTLDVNPARLL
jgi:hypothetical protein